MRTLDWIVVHTAGSYDYKRDRVVHQPVSVITQYHIVHNEWRTIGYHAYIEEDGTIEFGRPDEELGSHVGGFNRQSLGVCVSGHGDFEPFSQAQLSALIRKCASWCRLYRIPYTHVIGHRETDEHGGPPVSKTCPGRLVDMDIIRELVRARLETQA